MKSSLKSLNYKINESKKFSGGTRLYLNNRESEFFTSVEKLSYGKKKYNDQTLYVDDWANLSKHLSSNLPLNIFCFGAASFSFPDELKEHNIIFATFKTEIKEIAQLAEDTPYDYAQTSYLRNLLDALHEASLEKICALTATACGNPVFILDFNFRAAAISFLETDSPDIINICAQLNNSQTELETVSPEISKLRVDRGLEFVNFTHQRSTMLKMQEGEILTLPTSKLRFYLIPVMQSNVSVSSIMVVEDRVKLSRDDLEIIRSAAKGMEILEVGSRVLGDSGKPIYEYALVRALTDEFGTFGVGATARFTSLGYALKNHMRVVVLSNNVYVETYDARSQNLILARQLRTVVGAHGLCTTVNSYIVIFLNMDSKERMGRVLLDLRLFSSKNNLKVGISPWFDDIEELKVNYQRARDALAVGQLIMPDSVIFFQENLRMYKMVIDAFKNMPPTDLIPESLERLIAYDHAHNTDFVKTLYCHLQTLGNSKLAAEKLNIHRNTYFYRMDKIYEIMGTKILDGNDFIELSIGYYALEFLTKQNGQPLEFEPNHKVNEPESV